MESKDFKELENFARAAKKTMETVLKQVEDAKKNMSPEEIEQLEKEMSKHDMKGALSDLNGALTNFKEVINQS